MNEPEIVDIASIERELKSARDLKKKKLERAVEAYRDILKADTSNASAWFELGNVLRRLRYFSAALACAQRAVELAPEGSKYLQAIGDGFLDLNRLEDALQVYRHIVTCHPDNVEFRVGYANCLAEVGRTREALAELEIAKLQAPDNVAASWTMGELQLELGQWSEGWKNYEARLSMRRLKLEAPVWSGEDINGKTILLVQEQGFGDTILLSRYIPLLKARGAEVLLMCWPTLHRLLHTVEGLSRLFEPAETTTPFHRYCSMFSLPGIFGTELASIPPPAPLYVPAAPPPEAARLLDVAKDRFKVGIVWSGRSAYPQNHKRAVHARRFIELAADVPGVQLFSLQKGPEERELTECHGQAVTSELMPYVRDFADTAAILKHLDLVIMTDSSVAHLAGSISCPVWNLLARRPYWLYMRDREDTPWYPSMRLFRQTEPGNWDTVFQNVTAELRKAVAMKQAGQWRAGA